MAMKFCVLKSFETSSNIISYIHRKERDDIALGGWWKKNQLCSVVFGKIMDFSLKERNV